MSHNSSATFFRLSSLERFSLPATDATSLFLLLFPDRLDFITCSCLYAKAHFIYWDRRWSALLPVAISKICLLFTEFRRFLWESVPFTVNVLLLLSHRKDIRECLLAADILYTSTIYCLVLLCQALFSEKYHFCELAFIISNFWSMNRRVPAPKKQLFYIMSKVPCPLWAENIFDSARGFWGSAPTLAAPSRLSLWLNFDLYWPTFQ